MVMTPSTMLPLGTAAPDFSLPGTEDRLVSLSDFSGAPGLLIMFLCNHCPFVKHIAAGFVEFARDVGERGVAVVARLRPTNSFG